MLSRIGQLKRIPSRPLDALHSGLCNFTGIQGRLGLCSLLCVLATLPAGCADEIQPHTRLKLAHSLDTGHPVHRAMEFMASELEQLSDGSMRLEIHPSGQLGGERQLIELLQIGSLAMTKVSASPMEGFAPEMRVFSIPYVFRDSDHYWQFLDSDKGRELLLSLRRVRLRGLVYYDAGSRSFYMTSKPVHSPADLAGQKIRVQESQTSVKMIDALGEPQHPLPGENCTRPCSRELSMAPKTIRRVFIFPATTKPQNITRWMSTHQCLISC